MRYHLLILALLFILIGLSYYNENKNKEGFATCSYSDCKGCASASGCSWCPSKNSCISSELLKSSDLQCNQFNTVTSFDQCNINPNSLSIADKPKPPNVYHIDTLNSSDIDDSHSPYSANTVMGQLHHMENKLDSVIQNVAYCIN
jgi:hypothetical protein